MKERTREEPKIVAAAERQMRAWSLAQEIAESSARHPSGAHRVDEPHARLRDFITISREEGTGGSEIAEQVGRELGWEVLDRALVRRVAERFRLSRPTLELVDETSSSWAYDIFGSWFDSHIIPQEKYVVLLSRIVQAAARRGNVVLVGRGAQFLLPREQGLAVRIIASEKYRVARVRDKYGLREARAREYIAEADRGRAEFVARYFHHDVADPHLYDLVINVDYFGPDAVAEEIVAAWHRRESRRAAQPAATSHP